MPSNFTELELKRINPELLHFQSEVLRGLEKPAKSLSAKFFYDAKGSELFDEICRQPEYYPTRTELSILKERAREIAEKVGENAVIVEYGSGSGEKIKPILDALKTPSIYIEIDISKKYLATATERLHHEYPRLKILPIQVDFTQELALPLLQFLKRSGKIGKKFGFFPGSTLGNFDPASASHFLKNVASTLGKGGAFVVGVDTKKDRAILEAAYNDQAGVTAEFNLNLLRRINEELEGNFVLSRFKHEALYNASQGRMEMHLMSLINHWVTIGKHKISFQQGERIHTENSYKYSPEEFRSLAMGAGFDVEAIWTDSREYFGVYYLVVR